MEILNVLLPIALIIGVFFFLRSFGAWMFRIDEVVSQLEKINYQLNKLIKQNQEDS